MGYDGVEFAGLYGNTPADIAKMCKEIGLVPISAHVPYLDMCGAPKGILAKYAEVGCKFVAVPYLTPDYRPGTPCWGEVVENIKMLGEEAKGYGIQLLYHNHDFEFMKVDGKYALDELYDSVPADLLKTEQDTCWVNVAGEDPAAYLVKYTGRAPVVHIRDFVMKNRNAKEGLYELIGIKPTERQADEGDFAFRPAGYGIQDFPSILEAAKKAGSEWLVVEQDRTCLGWDSLDCIKKAVDYLKTINK